jgi:hypothetical protein
MRAGSEHVARGVSDLAKDASDEKRSWSHSRLVVGCVGSYVHREPNAQRY